MMVNQLQVYRYKVLRSIMKFSKLLDGVYDIHVHCSPDVIPRAEGLVELARSAHEAKMGGIGLKEHTTSTVGRAYALNQMFPDGPRFFSALALNPPVGRLNPVAVDSALRSGTDIIYFPTYGSKHHVSRWGAGKPPTAFPLPEGEYEGITILDESGALKQPCLAILALIGRYDAVLATGHLSPEESLVLIKEAPIYGVKRMVVTHASLPVISMPVSEQIKATQFGAMIEHCFFATTESRPDTVPLAEIGRQIREVGVEHVILSSDFGQVVNGAIVEGFGRHLEKMVELGFSEGEIKIMCIDNPRRLLERRGRNE